MIRFIWCLFGYKLVNRLVQYNQSGQQFRNWEAEHLFGGDYSRFGAQRLVIRALKYIKYQVVIMLEVVGHSHTKSAINSSFMVNFVAKMVDVVEDDEMLDFLKEIKMRVSLIRLEAYRSGDIKIENLIITVFTVNGLAMDEYIMMNARFYRLMNELKFGYRLQLSPLKSSHQTRSKEKLSDCKDMMISFFRNNRSIVKLIQNFKHQDHQPNITTDQMISLLIQLVQTYIGEDELNEDDIIDLLQNHTSLKNLVLNSMCEPDSASE